MTWGRVQSDEAGAVTRWALTVTWRVLRLTRRVQSDKEGAQTDEAGAQADKASLRHAIGARDFVSYCFQV